MVVFLLLWPGNFGNLSASDFPASPVIERKVRLPLFNFRHKKEVFENVVFPLI